MKEEIRYKFLNLINRVKSYQNNGIDLTFKFYH